jgi:hypothetical protein
MERQSGEIEAMSGWSRERCDRLSGIGGNVIAKAIGVDAPKHTYRFGPPRFKREGEDS